MIKLHLFDIEGTTTDIDFVHEVLFPYSEIELGPFILSNQQNEVVMAGIQKVKDTVWVEEQKQLGLYEVVDKLRLWIKEDRKHTALKEIQGLIWDIGYSSNHFKGHVYPDVQPFFKRIRMEGSKIGIYSSGSVHAQKLIFGYSQEGDLTPLISCFFDTGVGPKREPDSYQNIVDKTGLEGKEIHFYSDIVEELEAAQKAGLSVTLVQRKGLSTTGGFNSVTSFHELMEKL